MKYQRAFLPERYFGQKADYNNNNNNNISLMDKSLFLVWCRGDISSLLYSSHESVIVLLLKNTLESSINWVTSCRDVISRQLGSTMCWILVKNFWRTYCRVWHSAKKCCLVSGLLSQSLQVGSTANWLKTARLLCKVYVPVRIRDFNCALRLSCKLLCTDDHTRWAFPWVNVF